MRVRLPFAGTFFILLCLAAYAGLSSLQVSLFVNDKLLHFVTFFLLTIVFYWILDTSRRRALNLTLAVCTGGLGVGSEFLQSFLPNDRDFDIYDIAANLAGSLLAVGVCSWYHRRMLARRRSRKHYAPVPGAENDDEEGGYSRDDDDDDDDGDGDGDNDDDIELGESTGPRTAARSGNLPAPKPVPVIVIDGEAQSGRVRGTLEDEVDNWDENAADEDWDSGGDIGDLSSSATRSPKAVDGEPHRVKQRSD